MSIKIYQVFIISLYLLFSSFLLASSSDPKECAEYLKVDKRAYFPLVFGSPGLERQFRVIQIYNHIPTQRNFLRIFKVSGLTEAKKDFWAQKVSVHELHHTSNSVCHVGDHYLTFDDDGVKSHRSPEAWTKVFFPEPRKKARDIHPKQETVFSTTKQWEYIGDFSINNLSNLPKDTPSEILSAIETTLGQLLIKNSFKIEVFSEIETHGSGKFGIYNLEVWAPELGQILYFDKTLNLETQKTVFEAHVLENSYGIQMSDGVLEIVFKIPHEIRDKKIRILVVDDQELVRSMLVATIESIFKDQNIEIIEATNGKEAWDIIQNPNQSIDLVYTDNDMPQMSGLTLISKIQSSQLENTPKIILNSGYDLKAEGVVPSGVLFLQKPTFRNKIKEAIEASLGKSLK